MSTEYALRPLAHRAQQLLKHVASGLVVIVLLIGGFWGSHLLLPKNPHGEDPESHPGEPPSQQPATTVHLTPQKQQSAGIHVSPVTSREMQATRTVPATIDYDTTRYLTFKAPVDCVVEQLSVKPGQSVDDGQSMVALSSSEIALARAQIGNCKADVRLAEIQSGWHQQTRNNLVNLLEILKTRPAVADVESQFRGRILGDYRDDVLASYARLLLASSVLERTRPLGEQGVVAGRTAETRTSQRDAAATAFNTACEQSEFRSRQELTEAEAALEVARRQLAVAEERLHLLLGPFANETQARTQGQFVLKAPFEGRVEILHASKAARIAKGEPLLVMANLTRLHVKAMIHQHDWNALDIAADQILQVYMPAFPDQSFPAKVSFVGPNISPETRAVSLVANLDNSAGQFRPGMFAWVSVPVETLRRGLVVPTSAIQRHESETFVFVADAPGRYRRIDVGTGIETSEYVEVTQGLAADTRVVDQGAFYLKSELLLEQEDE